ncbi:MAG: DUF2511 domain-containing protein [Agitococcus sp.]|nr:DUF2511 domain-containing protein [Agitococcus sp.]
MKRFVIALTLSTLQAFSNCSQVAQAASVEGRSLGAILNQEYAVPIQSKAATSALVSRKDYGEDWQFVMNTGILGCENQLYPYFKAKGHTYKLTEQTKPEYESVIPIWRGNPNKIGTKFSLLEVIEVAMNFCKVRN